MEIEEIDPRIIELYQKDSIVRDAVNLGINNDISQEEFLIRLVEVLVKINNDNIERIIEMHQNGISSVIIIPGGKT